LEKEYGNSQVGEENIIRIKKKADRGTFTIKTPPSEGTEYLTFNSYKMVDILNVPPSQR